MVNVGIIGLGSRWESHYLPAIRRLHARIRIQGIYDSVGNRAILAGSHLRAPAVGGALALARRRNVQGLLVLDTGWQGDELVWLLSSCGKPTYVADRFTSDWDNLRQRHHDASTNGLTMMPAFENRYTPATARLQELIATRLGRPRQISVEIEVARPKLANGRNQTGGLDCVFDAMVKWFDWCVYVFRTSPSSLSAHRFSAAETSSKDESIAKPKINGQTIRLTFGDTAEHGLGDVPTAEIQITIVDSNSAINPDSTSGRVIVECVNGRAVLEDAARIIWQTDFEPQSESLTSERSAIEVMLDHFCRRVVGGLIPVTDLNDVCRGLELAQATQQSLSEGKPVALNGQT